jgi:FkbM family methyltransferase
MLIPFNRTQGRRGTPQPGLWERYNINPKGVLHIGGNRGEEAPVYLELGVTKQIWIEANPEIFVQLKETLRGNPDALAYNYAIGDKDFENTILHVANNGGQSSSLLQLGTHKTQHPDVYFTNDIPVVMRRIDSLIPADVIVNYDFLNVDVQGFEGQVLKGIGDYLHGFKWLYLEINTNKVYEDCALVGEIDDYVKRYGFYRVETKMVGNWGDALYIKQQ